MNKVSEGVSLSKVLAVVSMPLYGFFTEMVIEVSLDNMVIFSAAIIAGLLTYYNSFISESNAEKESTRQSIDDFVNCGWEFLKSVDYFVKKTINDIPYRDDYVRRLLELNKELNLKSGAAEMAKLIGEGERKIARQRLQEFVGSNKKENEDLTFKVNSLNSNAYLREIECQISYDKFISFCDVADVVLREQFDKEGFYRESGMLIMKVAQIAQEFRDKEQEYNMSAYSELEDAYKNMKRLLTSVKVSALGEENALNSGLRKKKENVIFLVLGVGLFCMGYILSNSW